MPKIENKIEDSVRVKICSGKIDKKSILTFDDQVILNSGENGFTILRVDLPEIILEDYRIYFEFLLPSKERFISINQVPYWDEIEDVDEITRQPTTKKVLRVDYRVPRYVARFAGVLLCDVKATNDSVTVFKSKTASLTVNQTVESEDDVRYYEGDLLDYLVMNQINDMKYINGWLHIYVQNPNTGEQTERGAFPINPLFENRDAAADWAMNSEEATIGQMITCIAIEDDNHTPAKVTAYLINPDRTLTHLSTEGNTSYVDFIDKPYIDTKSEPGVLPTVENEEIYQRIMLTRVAKTGLLSDTINDRKFVSMLSLGLGDKLTMKYDEVAQLIIDKVIVNNNSNKGFVINHTHAGLTAQIFSSDDIDCSVEAEYNIGTIINFSKDDELAIEDTSVVEDGEEFTDSANPISVILRFN